MIRVALLVLFGSVLVLGGCDSSEDAGQCDVGFVVDDLVDGTGAEAAAGMTAVVHYDGFLCDADAPNRRGQKFDSSRDRGTPFAFVPGAGTVIQGWEVGVPGMKVGGRRQLTIPPELAYGDRGSANVIPPDATLIFDIELIEVR